MSEAVKTISLALQGGGTHGAFTWGVLDTLLRCPDLNIDAISGTSAGAVNAAVLLSAWRKASFEGHSDDIAKAVGLQNLALFWQALSQSPVAGLDASHWFDPLGVFKNTPWDPAIWTGSKSSMLLQYSPGFVMADWMTRLASPYEFNPTGWNPLKNLLEQFIDSDVFLQPLKQDMVIIPKLFVSATQVETGQVRVFDESELSSTVLMASACLPFLFQAVDIEGKHYWDGGYTGNPALMPLIQAYRNKVFKCNLVKNKISKRKIIKRKDVAQVPDLQDIVMIAINPVEREAVPTQSRDILNRIHEISFNSSLAMEWRGIEQVNRWFENPDSASIAMQHGYHPVKLHCIDGTIPETANLADLDPSSKWQVDERFLTALFQSGQQAAQDWLTSAFKSETASKN